MLASIKGLLTPPIVIGATVVIAIIAVGATYFSASQHPSATYVMPTIGPLVQEVDSTGSVNAAKEIDLGFQTGGTIANAGPRVGAHVGAGATLGALRGGTQQAAVEQAQAALAIQQANLSSLQAGTRPESIAVSQTAVTNAQASLAQSEQSLIATAQDAYAKSDDAIVNRVDQFISNPHTASPSFNLTLSNSQDQTNIVSGRIQMETLLNTWQQMLAALPSDPTHLDTSALASTTRANLGAVSSYLSLVASGLSEAVPSTIYTSATIQGYESSIATARTNVSTDLSGIDSAQTALTTAQSALASAQSQLTLAQAPATSQSVQAQQAQVASAQASVDAATALLAQTVISAPISGTITVNNMEPGEIAAPGATQVSMISDTAFQFVTYVSETDLAEIKTGDAAQVQLDAYQGQAPVPATVIQIDPAATVQNGVASYKVTLQFSQNDPRISSGETGSAKIITQSLSGVMSIPTSAVIMSNGGYSVIKRTSSGNMQVPVQIGIASASGFTQILSGLSPSDEVQTFGASQ
jgi:RND family efflux transporter MFP subunit